MDSEIEKFFSAIDAMVTDMGTRDRIKADTAQTYNREFAQLSGEYHDKVSGQPLSELRSRISGAYPYHLDRIPDAIADFTRELRAGVIHERATNPALNPPTPESEIKRNAGAFSAKHYSGNEQAELQRMLKPGDKIARIGLRSIELASGRVITRRDLREHAIARRPANVTPDNETFLRQNFTSDLMLDDIETAERVARKEASVYRAGPPNLIGKPLPAAQGE